MSVINKMLKDLDKRGSEAASGSNSRGAIRSIPDGRRSGRPLLWILLLLLISLSGAYAWWFWDGELPSFVKQSPQVLASAPSPTQTAPAQTVTPTLPVAPPVAVEASAPQQQAAVTSPVMPPVVATPLESKAAQPSQPALVAQKSERITAAKPIVAPVADEGTEKQVLNKSLASITTPEARAVKPPVAHERTKRGATAQGPARMSKETTPEQQAENAYSKAVSLIESGQRQEAITALESLLGQTPRHASARQTLVGLLLDAKRPADATRVLQEGLKLDPARTGMAMVLARIQVEKGDIKAALVSLQQSLPYAAKAPDYYAFMAALFQREKRHQEAIEHYRVALGMVPGNGLWLMGYGISLQAENRLPEARTAFIQARDSGKLAPDLRAFVEQRISQLR